MSLGWSTAFLDPSRSHSRLDWMTVGPGPHVKRGRVPVAETDAALVDQCASVLIRATYCCYYYYYYCNSYIIYDNKLTSFAPCNSCMRTSALAFSSRKSDSIMRFCCLISCNPPCSSNCRRIKMYYMENSKREKTKGSLSRD